MLLIYSREGDWNHEEWTKCTIDSSAVCHELAAKGKFLDAAPLHPVATAKSVRVREGKALVTDGPFAETHEQLGGYFLIDVANLDEAIAIAARLPAARKGTVEVRPVLSLPDLPAVKIPVGNRVQMKDDRYMLLCYDDEQAWNAAGQAALHAAMMEAVELTKQIDARGQYLCASPLHPKRTATSVRIRNGRRTLTDGPFAETREVLGGFYLLTATNVDEVIDIAAQHSGARVGTVEVRRVFELPPIPIKNDCDFDRLATDLQSGK
jgi:hypothetical protein